MSQAFGNGKRNISGTDHAKDLRHQHQYTFAKNLSKDRCGYVNNDTLNDQFTIRYDYRENQLISRVRNVKNYDTLYSLAQGHNVCECLAGAGAGGGAGFNVGGELYYKQQYSSQDLSGIEFYDDSGNKVFDSVLFDECARKSYSVYDNVFTGTMRDQMYDTSQYMRGFNYPKQIPLHIEYANPKLILYSAFPSVIYLRDIDTIKLGKIVEECYHLEESIKDITAHLLKRFVSNIEYTETETIYTYDTIELGSNILGGVTDSSYVEDSGLNIFTDLQVLKPDTYYYYKFTGNIVQDLTTDYFNVKGKLNNLLGDGFDNTILDNDIFTVTDVSGQGSIAGGSTVVFKPDSLGDFYYQDGSNDNTSSSSLPVSAIAGIIIGVCVFIMIVLGSVVYWRSRKHENEGNINHDNENQNTRGPTTSLQLKTQAKDTTYGDMSVASGDYSHNFGNTADGNHNNISEELVTIYTPSGKLGMIIDSPDDGAPIIHNIKDGSPIYDKINVGDRLVAVDDEDTRNMTAIKVSKLISRKSDCERKLTVIRYVSG